MFSINRQDTIIIILLLIKSYKVRREHMGVSGASRDVRRKQASDR